MSKRRQRKQARQEAKRAPKRRYRIEPIAPILAGAGAVAVAIALFLPLTQNPGGFVGIQDNTLAQHGGIIPVLLAIACAVGVYRAFRGHYRLPGSLVVSLITLAFFIYQGASKGNQTLYPVGPDGQPDVTQAGTHAGLGIAVYVGGLGALLLVAASWMVTRAKPLGTAPVEGIKQCPDCAETIQAEARVCKHCGYRFPEQVASG